MLQRVAEVAQLLFHQQAGGRLAHQRDHRLDRRMRPVRRAERVVDVDVGERRERLRERRIVLFLFGMKPQVLEQDHASVGRTADRRLRRGADAVLGERHRPVQQFGQPCGDRPQAHLRIRLALRPPEMRRQDDA